MRISFLLPSLFAAALLSTTALADRNDDTDRGSAPMRGSAAKERVVRESRTREAKETRARVQTKETPTKATSDRKPADKLAQKHGCSTDDGSSCTSKTSERTVKAPVTTTDKASARVAPTKVRELQRGCSTEDGSGCTSSAKHEDGSAKQTGGARQYVVQTDPKAAAIQEEIMKMRAKVDAERILDMLKLQMCERKGTCDEFDR